MKKILTALMLSAASALAKAAPHNQVDLGTPSSGPLQSVGKFLQAIVDFTGGTGVVFIVFVSACAAIGLWVVAPKQGSTAVAWGLRICVGAILVFNVALLISWYESF